jgi:hypothetical protein
VRKKGAHRARTTPSAIRRCQTQYNHRSIARFCDKIRTGVQPLYMHGHRYRFHDLVCVPASVGPRHISTVIPIPFGYQGRRQGGPARASVVCGVPGAGCLCKSARRRKMQEATSPLPVLSNGYQPLPALYLGFLAIWAASGFSWAFSTWRNRHYQVLPEAIVPEFSIRRVFLCFVCGLPITGP